MSECYIALYFLLSYMDTEQYEEAVRDYEKVYQTEKTKGKFKSICFSGNCVEFFVGHKSVHKVV